jgi:ubiquinone/menaquinone biosynthesis C-methylase UbiE
VPFEELKARQSVMWANGPYQNITETIADIHDLVVDLLEPAPGVRWLDLACGTGAVAERAAAAGADVIGVDLAPGLLETARERASRPSTIAWVTAKTSILMTPASTWSRRRAA